MLFRSLFKNQNRSEDFETPQPMLALLQFHHQFVVLSNSEFQSPRS